MCITVCLCLCICVLCCDYSVVYANDENTAHLTAVVDHKCTRTLGTCTVVCHAVC